MLGVRPAARLYTPAYIARFKLKPGKHRAELETEGQQLSEAMAQEAAGKIGVGERALDQLKQAYTAAEAGGRAVPFFPGLLWFVNLRINFRNHRKILVVDGEVGFTGGVGIADNWDGDASGPDHWRDSHYRLQGPAVAQMQAAFMDNWIKTTGTVLQGKEYFPPLPAVGEARAQVFTSSPSGGGDSMLLMYLLSITAAERTIDLSASYFVPDDLTRAALRAALERGVRVRIIVPGEHIDTEVVRKASRAQWGELLEAGAEIHEFQPTMFHCKMLIVDQLMVSVGSTNFDNRSFRLNDEANLNVYDAEFARHVSEVFEEDLARARRITYEAWQARPWQQKLLEHASALLSSQL
jgi:cardiolipin synthase